MPLVDFDACLLIFLPGTAKNRRGCDGTDVHGPDVEAEQALTIALALRAAGGASPLLLCAKGDWAHREALAHGLPHLAVGYRCNPWNLLKLRLWQRRYAFLLIQTVGESALFLGHLVRRWRRDGTTVLAHAFFVTPPSGKCRKSKSLWAAHKIFCGNGGIRQTLLEADPGGMDERFVLLAPGINRQRYAPDLGGEVAETENSGKEAMQKPPVGERFIFGMGRGLVARSGVLTVVRAMAALWQVADLPPWEMRVTGSGPRFAEALEEAERLGVASRLCLLGEQYAPDFLAACHAWLAPGLSSEEMPDAFWAGFAAGLPVICSKSALHMERLAGRDAALVVEPDDPQALAGAMIALMSDSGLRQDLSARAATLREQCGLERMAGEVCRFFSFWGEDLRNKTTDAGGMRE
ncbi:MAG: glycosyltransferase family 4 protein [Desulfovibrio sp.]|jgi:glycosyltransferase involved in cell wall biosynthesis|nr:glycosyltransferase family 4 protein [Desulfovibrio sp.]